MKGNWITNVLVTILIILVTILIVLQLKQQGVLDSKITSAVANISQPTQLAPKDGEDGVTPIKGIHYFDGEDGKDSLSKHTIEKETIVKENQIIKEVIKEVPIEGKPGLTPILQCNTEKNRWEFRNDSQDRWSVLNGTPVKCTIDL